MKISVTSASFSKNIELRAELLKLSKDAAFNDAGIRYDKQAIIDYLRDSTAAVVGLESIDDEVLAACPNLKIIAKYGVGLDNIDIEACQKRGVAIGWSGGVNRLSVAEMTLGFMLMLSRNLYVTSNLLKSGVWNKSGGFQLSGKTVGIIGFGFIGQEVARLLAPFGCELAINDIVDKKAEIASFGAKAVSKDEIFEKADFITIHTPLTDETRNLIDVSVLKKIKNSSFVINTARGGIVDEIALKEALKNGDIAGAAIDAYLDEPPSDKELLALPNLICTPHIGGNADEAVLAMGGSAIKHLREFFMMQNEE